VGDLSSLSDAAPGSVSYHLSVLEEFGFVAQAPELARDGRQRWWRAAHEFTRFDPGQLLSDPEAASAARVMRQGFLQHHLAEELAYLDAEPGLPREWVDAATSGDTLAYLTPEELRELSAELDALALRWTRSREDAPPGALPVRLIYSAFRQP
jgi:hypothetical protein